MLFALSKFRRPLILGGHALLSTDITSTFIGTFNFLLDKEDHFDSSPLLKFYMLSNRYTQIHVKKVFV